MTQRRSRAVRFSGVSIDSGQIEATDKLRNVSREKWLKLMLRRKYFLATEMTHVCRSMVEFCFDAQEMHVECGFSSAEAMIREGYGLKPEDISIALRWLDLNPPLVPVDEERLRFARELAEAAT